MATRAYGQLIIQTTAPEEDPVMVGTLWSDTTTNTVKVCTAVAPYTFAAMGSTFDVAAEHDWSADQWNTGGWGFGTGASEKAAIRNDGNAGIVQLRNGATRHQLQIFGNYNTGISDTDTLLEFIPATTSDGTYVIQSHRGDTLGASRLALRCEGDAASAVILGSISEAIAVIIVNNSGTAGAKGVQLRNDAQFAWTAGGADPTTANDTGLKRSAAATVKVTDGTSGYGAVDSLYQRFGAGDPEGVVTAPVGAIYHRTDGGAGSSFYVKESGSGNTGWQPK